MTHRTRHLSSIVVTAYVLVASYKFHSQYEGNEYNVSTLGSWETVKSFSSKAAPPYAYVYLIAGCDPYNCKQHRGMLLNVMISAYLLKQQFQSTADVLALVQIKYATNTTELPPNEVDMLKKLGIVLKYIPKSRYENFYEAQFEKFRVLGLTSYRRVLYMDADIMPLGKMDYLFELSELGVLSENVVIGSRGREPANGGFFMLTPGHGEYERAMKIIHSREIAARNIPGKFKFDENKGWGHEIVPPDCWESVTEKGYYWNFSFAYADMGFLYHWVKYEKKSVSVILAGDVINFVEGPNRTIKRRETLYQPFRNYSKVILRDEGRACRKWLCDFAHFTSGSKPWLHKPPLDLRSTPPNNALHLWYGTLDILDRMFGMGYNLTHERNAILNGYRTPLGTWPLFYNLGERVVRTASAANLTSAPT